MLEFFGQEYELTISTVDGDGRAWRDLSIQFDVFKTAKPDPNTGSFTIHNLSENSRGWIERASKVFIRAGYESQGIRSIFAGDITRVSSSKSGNLWTTEVECGDGRDELQAGHVQATISPGSSPAAMIESFKESLSGLDFSDGFEGALRSAISNQSGTTVDGSAREELTAILEPAGFEWSVQDGVLQVVAVDGALPVSDMMLLRPDTGLLYTKKTDEGVEVGSLLSGLIKINRPIKVESSKSKIGGIYIPKSVRHVGDTHGSDWQTVAECVEL